MRKNNVQSIKQDKVIFLTLISLCIAVLALYMYLLSASIVHVVIRKEISQDLVKLNSEISELETEYMTDQHRVSNQIASLEGYQEVTDKIFIDRTPDSLAFSGQGE